MKSRANSLRRCVIACVAALAILATPFVGAGPAQAQVVGFNPGNIISDSLFYNGNAMSTSEVQAFLNQRVPRCTIGDPGRAAGMAWGTTRIADRCLRDFSMPTISRSANAMCDAYVGRPNETAAEIITKVGQACGISQRVLLITLEKEQSLVSDSWPTERQIAIATGYACPDSGPNWSANCNPEYYGFQNQVYYAAWQLKLYRANPHNYNFKPFQANSIQYHPNPACGSSQVYIENWATAALYIYTPYQPNAASLAAGWGTGDACSAYGNRNFYNLYTAWFGSTQGYAVSGDIAAYWHAQGGAEGIYGHPAGSSVFYSTRYSGGLWLQYFSGGIIVTEMNTGKTSGIPFGAIFEHYNGRSGGIFGPLGAPLSDAMNYTVNGGALLQWFQGGLLISVPNSGSVASVAYGPVYDLYNDVADGIYGELGYPLGEFDRYSGGQLQNFQGGIIAQADSAQTLVFVSGAFFTYYNDVAEGIYGRLGWPVGNQTTGESGTAVQEFERGYLAQAANGEIAEISGTMLAPYRQAERAGTPLGAPVSGVVSVPMDQGAQLVQFENGVILTENRTRKTSVVAGDMFAHYNGVLDGVYGPYGYPVGDETRYVANGGGTLQVFRNGLLFTSDQAESVAAMLYASPIYSRYNGTEGGIYGWLGYPTADEVRAPDGSRSQQFQHGVIAVAPNGDATVLPTETFQLYQDSGGATGPLGRQTSATRFYATGSGAWLSFFAEGLITQESNSRIAASLQYSAPLYRYYNSQAQGIYGPMGYPLTEAQVDASGILAQRFQYGVLRRAPDGQVFVFGEGAWAKYLAVGAESGPLGAPLGDRYEYSASGGGTVQVFQHGLITEELRTGQTAALPYGPIYDYYNNVMGGIYGPLGYPVSDQVVSGSVVTQQFQHGKLTLSGGVVTRSS